MSKCGYEGCGKTAFYLGRKKQYCEEHREQAVKEVAGKKVYFHRDPKRASAVKLKPRRVR